LGKIDKDAEDRLQAAKLDIAKASLLEIERQYLCKKVLIAFYNAQLNQQGSLGDLADFRKVSEQFGDYSSKVLLDFYVVKGKKFLLDLLVLKEVDGKSEEWIYGVRKCAVEIVSKVFSRRSVDMPHHLLNHQQYLLKDGWLDKLLEMLLDTPGGKSLWHLEFRQSAIQCFAVIAKHTTRETTHKLIEDTNLVTALSQSVGDGKQESTEEEAKALEELAKTAVSTLRTLLAMHKTTVSVESALSMVDLLTSRIKEEQNLSDLMDVVGCLVLVCMYCKDASATKRALKEHQILKMLVGKKDIFKDRAFHMRLITFLSLPISLHPVLSLKECGLLDDDPEGKVVFIRVLDVENTVSCCVSCIFASINSFYRSLIRRFSYYWNKALSQTWSQNAWCSGNERP